MKKWLHKIELAVDWLIPWLVLVLLGIIVIELFFHDFAEHHHTVIMILDYFVLVIFVFDLVFKYFRIRNVKKFFKTCWLDILAVFPFFILFRFIERFIIIIDLSKDLTEFQKFFHEGLELEKSSVKIIEEGSKIIQEAEKAGKVSRVQKIVQFSKPVQKSPRILKALPFFEEPTGKHHIHDPEQEFEDVGKSIENLEEKVVKDVEKGEKFIEGEVEKGEKFLGKEVKMVERDILKSKKYLEKKIRKKK